MLVCINGTGSADWTKAEREASFVFKFFKQRSDAYKAYWDGPDNAGVKVPGIVNGAWSWMQSLLRFQCPTTIELVGYSRGGAIAVELAWRLKDAGQSVSFLGLFDAVDRSILTRTDTIPGTVSRAAHARRDPSRMSRDYGISFSNTGTAAMQGCTYVQDFFFTTHGGMGGALGDAFLDPVGNKYGDFLKWANKGQDVDKISSNTVWMWMALEARKAGIRDVR